MRLIWNIPCLLINFKSVHFYVFIPVPETMLSFTSVHKFVSFVRGKILSFWKSFVLFLMDMRENHPCWTTGCCFMLSMNFVQGSTYKPNHFRLKLRKKISVATILNFKKKFILKYKFITLLLLPQNRLYFCSYVNPCTYISVLSSWSAVFTSSKFNSWIELRKK